MGSRLAKQSWRRALAPLAPRWFGGLAWRVSGSIHELGCFAMVWLAMLAGVFLILAPVGGWAGGADSVSDHSKLESPLAVCG